jgi:hypothetical protein
MTLLVTLAALTAVAAAARSTWSPCGLSMLSTITPMAERSRGRRWGLTALWFVLGAVLGGATLGLLAAAGAAGATLGATTIVSPRAPYAADKAWLNATLGVSDVFDGSVIVLAYPDEFAPQGAIDVIVKATAGRRYLVECTALTVGAPATRASIFAGASSYAAATPVTDATLASATPGAVVSVLTPAAATPFLRVSLDVPRGAIAANGQAALVTDKCEVTPVS